jgi:hypothetical protein
MALFPNIIGDAYFKGKTHTNLVVSEGNAPSEKLIVDSTETIKFAYAYGPKGNQNVVLAKGKVVDLGVPQFDPETSHTYPTIKTAGVGSKNAVGVNHANLYEVKRDRFSGNQANVITRSFIEVPLFEHGTLSTAQAYADAMKYGAAYGTPGGLVPGDFVKVGVNGNFVKLDVTADSPFQIIGQVWGVEKELPPAGFLQYYLDMDITELDEFFRNKAWAPSPGKTGPQSPNGANDAAAYPYGYPWTLHKYRTDFDKLMNPIINNGIPFLTDGYFKAKQTVVNIPITDIYNLSTNNSGQVEAVIPNGDLQFGAIDSGTQVFTASANGGTIVAASVKTGPAYNNALFIKLRHNIDRGEMNNTPITVKYTDGSNAVQTFNLNDIHVDVSTYEMLWSRNTVVVYLQPNTQYRNITIDAKLIVDPVAGVPTEWDYQGSVGAVRILLQR